MSKVIFSVQYEINSKKRDDYLAVVRELKNLLKAEGLENYSVFEINNKPNHFHEMFTFSSFESYEQFEDGQNERINILINKINDFAHGHSARYTLLNEVEI
jgi:quinol monooxygenase YgiN